MSALSIQNNWRTSVYATQIRTPRSAETISFDVFARRERAAAPRVFQIPVGSKEFKLTIENNVPVPQWIDSVINSMNERWGIHPGWDSYNARPTDSDHAIKLLNYLSQILPDEAVAPTITPLADGGLQAEWCRGDKDIEIVVPYNEPARYCYFDSATEGEEDEELEGNFDVVREHINSL